MKRIFFIALMLTGQLFAQQLEDGVYFSNKYSTANVKDNKIFNETILDPYYTDIFISGDFFKFCFDENEDCFDLKLNYYGLHHGFETYWGDEFKLIINDNVIGLSLLYDLNEETNSFRKTVEFWNLIKYEEEKEIQ
jgi:hypothetical protein